jgi:hypothetical protein
MTECPIPSIVNRAAGTSLYIHVVQFYVHPSEIEYKRNSFLQYIQSSFRQTLVIYLILPKKGKVLYINSDDLYSIECPLYFTILREFLQIMQIT